MLFNCYGCLVIYVHAGVHAQRRLLYCQAFGASCQSHNDIWIEHDTPVFSSGISTKCSELGWISLRVILAIPLSLIRLGRIEAGAIVSSWLVEAPTRPSKACANVDKHLPTAIRAVSAICIATTITDAWRSRPFDRQLCDKSSLLGEYRAEAPSVIYLSVAWG